MGSKEDFDEADEHYGWKKCSESSCCEGRGSWGMKRCERGRITWWR